MDLAPVALLLPAGFDLWGYGHWRVRTFWW
ncbi:hypothetical protein SAMN05444743_11345 [Pseudomonas sp. PDC86]|uniref:Uncharacterized protein n=1 Tax=Pseudomonas gorinensis TaxID=3240790 RepID=A0ACA7P8H0_9PSED|nr:hypothetical protein U771_17975 [Pseudomonas sp. TKP]SDZ35174.1 hypothetical protein SAMN05444743_11345 [Pseudomonas sp. PDC86]